MSLDLRCGTPLLTLNKLGFKNSSCQFSSEHQGKIPKFNATKGNKISNSNCCTMSDAEDDFMCEDEEDYGLVSKPNLKLYKKLNNIFVYF